MGIVQMVYDNILQLRGRALGGTFSYKDYDINPHPFLPSSKPINVPNTFTASACSANNTVVWREEKEEKVE